MLVIVNWILDSITPYSGGADAWQDPVFVPYELRQAFDKILASSNPAKYPPKELSV